jgi:hypothetical protein
MTSFAQFEANRRNALRSTVRELRKANGTRALTHSVMD